MRVQRVLEGAAFTMRQVAENAGVSYVTVRQWKSGRRVPDAENRDRLAEAFEKHAARLRELAGELREDVDHEGDA